MLLLLQPRECVALILLVLMILLSFVQVMHVSSLHDNNSNSNSNSNNEASSLAATLANEWKVQQWHLGVWDGNVDETPVELGENYHHVAAKSASAAAVEKKKASVDASWVHQLKHNATDSRIHPLMDLLVETGTIEAQDAVSLSQVYRSVLSSHPHATSLSLLPHADLTLPSWTVLERLYGNMTAGPVIKGMETCRNFIPTLGAKKKMVGPAGMFNTGTNAMKHYLDTNIPLKSLYQVPWGKHRMEWQRLKHVAPRMQYIQQENVLPVILIRDPYQWMQSMCKTPYAAKWLRAHGHCPSLVPIAKEIKRFGKKSFPNGTIPVRVQFQTKPTPLVVNFTSLIDLYNEYYGLYMNVDYPHLIVRFEDMLLRPNAVMKIIATCLDVPLPQQLRHKTDSAKKHGSHTSWIQALHKTGDTERRLQGMTDADKAFAAKELNDDIMDFFQYSRT